MKDIPYYDVWQDKIYNVHDTTSYSYFHELRHQQQNKLKFVRWMLLNYPFFQTIMLYVLFISMLVNGITVHDPHIQLFLLWLFVGCVSFYLFFKLILEIDATIYGLVHFKLLQK